MILALDPGSKKVGVALFEPSGRLVTRSVLNLVCLEAELISFLGAHRGKLEVVVVGNGTAAAGFDERLARVVGSRAKLVKVDETDTTFEARELYYDEFPPSGLMRFLPRGLWPFPDVPLDGYAAEVLGGRYLLERRVKKEE
jgi:hypothetical protein